MRNLKKLVALIVTIAMVAMLAIPAFAAPADVVGTEYEGAVARLMALGVITGYPDGNFGPEDSITRAEFAAVVVRALGLQDVADFSKGVTKFSDVPANHWAAGYINVASAQGIINGYGDGRFGPNDKVLFEQAVTMIVRALGQGALAESKGGYPAGYLIQAKAIGFTNNVKGVSGQPAPRGIVALLIDNAKDAKIYVQKGFGSSETWEEGTDTFLTLLGMDDIATGVIVTEVVDDVKFKVGNTQYKAVEGTVDVASLLGKKVNLWGSAPDKIVLAEILAGEEVAVKSVAYDVGNAVYKATLADGSTVKYKVADGAAGVLDYEFYADAKDILDELDGESADLVEISFIVGGDKIQYVSAVKYEDLKKFVSYSNHKVLKQETILVEGGSYSLRNGDNEIKKLVITRNGEAATVEDLKAGDQMFVSFDANGSGIADDILIIKATDAKVTGKFTAANATSATKVQVGGTWYNKSTKVASLSTEHLGKDVTLTLDPAGKVVSIDAADDSTPSVGNYAIVIDNEYVPGNIVNAAAYKIKMVIADGTTVVMDVKDTVSGISTDSNPLWKGKLVKYTVNSDGLVDSISNVTQVTADDLKINTVKMRYDGKDVSENVVIFKANNKLLKVTDIKNDTVLKAAYYAVEDGTIVAIQLKNEENAYVPASDTATNNYAYVTGVTLLADSKYEMNALTLDGAAVLTTSTSEHGTAGKLIRYDLDKVSGKVEVKDDDVEYHIAGEITEVSSSRIKVKDADTDEVDSYWFTDKTLIVFDAGRDGSDALALTKADLYAQMQVEIVFDSETHDLIAVIVTAM